MNKIILVLIMSVFIVGCSCQDKPKHIAIKINNYQISEEEFEKEFKDSSFGRFDSRESRKEFLDNLVDRILILQDAQKRGLDNDPQFLKMVEKFWMQSLLRLALEKKTEEASGALPVEDRDVEEAYQVMLKEGKASKPYKDMYQQIKQGIISMNESRLMNDWLVQLHKNADIRINKDLIATDNQGAR